MRNISRMFTAAVLLAVFLTALPAATLSGYVRTTLTVKGLPVSGVTMRLVGTGRSGKITVPIDVSTTTSSLGYYSFDMGALSAITYWSGTLTPSKSGYTFSPVNASFSTVTTSVTQNFAGSSGPVNYSVSGYVRTAAGAGVEGATVTFSNSGGSTTTSSTGYYSRSLASGWSGTVTPSKEIATGVPLNPTMDLVFAPVSRSVGTLGSNVANQNFALTTCTISGRVYNEGPGTSLSGAVIRFTEAGSTFTDANGYYSHVVDYGWKGTITGYKQYHVLHPEFLNTLIYPVDGDKTDWDFTFTVYITYTITATAGTGGSISPSGTVLAHHGNNSTFSIAAATGYRILDVQVDGIPRGAISTYTFQTVGSNHTIHAQFTPLTYTVTATQAAGGTISPTGTATVNYGGYKDYTITASTGYRLLNVVTDGVSRGAVTSYRFSNVTANHTISAAFEKLSYTVTASAGPGGTISPAGQTAVDYGQSAAYIITPDAGYIVDSLVVDGGLAGTMTAYTFSSVTASHTIRAVFTPEPVGITGARSSVYTGPALPGEYRVYSSSGKALPGTEWNRLPGGVYFIGRDGLPVQRILILK